MFTGKPASNRPKASKSVQSSKSVQPLVEQRIIDLKNSGMGARKISRQLEKEGTAIMSKSKVAEILKRAQTRHMSTKALPKDPALKTLEKTEAKLLKQVNKIQMRSQARQRIRDLQCRKAETPEGRQDIFKNSKQLRKFVEQTLYDSPVLKEFKRHCEAEGLPLAKTLSNVIGTLYKYEVENVDLFWPDLPSYIEERLDNYLEDEQRRKMQEQLQTKFSDFWLNFK